ncbi:MAG: sugar phosphate isomerase/epimerase [Candidatus Brocadiae bacterium]|nr:sugar phosphate isomerase/epimerase [Candidatus Brocadiia bacterium]
MRFAMCNEFCEGWDFAEVCKLAADAGYDGVEIAPFTLSDSVEEIGPSQRRRLQETAARRGLQIVGLHWLLAKPEGLHLNSPDAQVRARTADYLRAEIDFCADIGGGKMVVGSPKQRNVPPEQTYQEVWERSVAVFGELAQHAAARGVCLCIEPLASRETNFIRTAAEARRLVEAVGRPAFRMMLDVKAMHADEEPIPEIIRKSAPYLEHFHANDANLQGPGFGDTDFVPIAAALREAAYDGYVSVEVFDFAAGPERIARESLQYLKDVFA